VVGVNRRAAEPFSDGTPVLWKRAEEYSPSDPRSASACSRECGGLKARYQQTETLARPAPHEQISNHRASFGLAAACCFQLCVGPETEFGKKRQSFLQGRDALPRKGTVEPSPRVVTSNRGERERTNLATAIRRPLQAIIMKKYWVSVGCEPNVELDPAAVERLCHAKARERVFGRARCRSSVADHLGRGNVSASFVRDHTVRRSWTGHYWSQTKVVLVN
jgi:hypothetical protein